MLVSFLKCLVELSNVTSLILELGGLMGNILTYDGVWL